MTEWISFEHEDGGNAAYRRSNHHLTVMRRSKPLKVYPQTLTPDRTLPHGFNYESVNLVETLVTIETISQSTDEEFYVICTKCVWNIPTWSRQVALP